MPSRSKVIIYNAAIRALSFEVLQAMQRRTTVLGVTTYNAAFSTLVSELLQAMQRSTTVTPTGSSIA